MERGGKGLPNRADKENPPDPNNIPHPAKDILKEAPELSWDKFIKLLQESHKNAFELTAFVILPHNNGFTNVEAKKATSDGSSPNLSLPAFLHDPTDLPLSKSALKQKFYAELKVKNSQLFNKSPCCNTLQWIDESTPSKSFQNLV